MTSKYPPRGRGLFRKYNYVKAVRSHQAAGLEVGGVEIAPDGTIRVLSPNAVDSAGKTDNADNAATDLDNWIAKRDASQA
jgi:hypothetical protein